MTEKGSKGPHICIEHAGSFPHPLRGVNTPKFRTTPRLHILITPPNISQGMLNIIITFAKYEQYLVYVMFIVDSDGSY